MILLLSFIDFNAQTSVNFSSTSTFTVPAGVTSVTVEAWGGGGRGGSRTIGSDGYGGGGGGAYAKSILTVTPGNTYTVTVGGGSNSNSSDGGDSWFINNTTILAKGGVSVANNGTTGGAGGTAAASIGTVKFSGGNGANGSTGSYGGGGGSSAGTASNGGNGATNTGGNAPTGGGNGGNGRNTTSGSGSLGSSPGGGGGGALRTSGSATGGNGADGQVIITYIAVPAPEIDIQGNSVSIPDGNTTPLLTDWTDFGSSAVGSGTTRTFRIFNTGTTNLTIGALTFTGTNAADFAVTTAPSATVASGSSTTFVITFTPSAIGIRTATLNIVNNDSDENPYNFSIQGTGITPLTNGPGGIVTPLQLWFRSDLLDGTTTVADGSAVNTWKTQARGSNAIRPGSVGAPIYRNNPAYNINFNSVVDFTNNPATTPQNYTDLDPARQYLKGPTGFYSQDIFAVVLPDINVTSATRSLDIFCGDKVPGTNQTDGTGIGYGRYSERFSNEVLSYCYGTTSLSGGVQSGYGVAHVDATATITYNTAGIINASNNVTSNGMNLTFNANNVVNTTNDIPDFGNVNNSQFWIGRSEGWDGSLDGRIGEIITLDARASDTDRTKILSYLAIKYGITLGVNGTSMNYTNSDGNKIWDATANTGYNYDIAGIGRDDISKLNQKQSKSINPTEVMTIGLTDILSTNTANTSTFATNKSFLVWGANGGNMNDSGVDLLVDLGPTTITTITEVVNRKWKVVETGGDVATSRVAVPTLAFTSGLPALGPTDAYVMVVATNAAFTTGLETVFMSTSGTNQTCLYDFDATKYITFGVAHRATNPLHITLDGFDDFVRIDNVNELGADFSIMTWVRPNGANTLGNERTILAKTTTTNGYKLVLQNDNKVRMEWTVSGTTYATITNTALPDSIWHNVAVTYGSNTINIYIDGVLDKTASIATPPANTISTFSIGGQYINKSIINNLWKGDIDELRMWNRVVTPTEIRFIMNQEILQNGTGTKGTIIPTSVTKNDINGLLWNNLFAYYSMNSYIGTHLDDDSQNINRGSLVIPDKISINVQTAPMPYESNANGVWSANASWKNGTIQDVPYSLSIVDLVTPIDWNIVKTNHNIDSNGNKVLLGLFTLTNKLSANNDSKIEISHYLKLDGKIDLVGKSQLVQTLNSDLDPTSAGSIERDQQGTSNLFNYNYWSSPVGTINATTNNNTYTVTNVMKDGTTTTPQNITWTSGLNGSPTSPITLSNYWIFKFQNLSDSYSNWNSVGPTGILNPGQGYTLKGSGSASPTQNFTFVGKPNNGVINSTVAGSNLNLSGNPYASAINSDTFIDDNAASINGTLYFWQHSPTNNTHNLLAYQGGYATRTKTGGVAPVAPAGIAGVGTSTKVPGRYIPVGQGFFIKGSAAGGTINFNNNQRIFVKEDNVDSNLLFKSSSVSTSPIVINHFEDNRDSYTPENQYKKIRLGYLSADQYQKQVLLGFMEENATSGLDYGYDGINIDTQINDLYFITSGQRLNIQGDGFFNNDNIYPVGIINNVPGNVTIKIDAKENFVGDFEAYIYDNVTNVYNDVANADFNITLPQGTFDNRFSLRFKNPNALGNQNFDINNGIQVVYSNENNIINIKNNVIETTINTVSLYNLLGQSVGTWDTKNLDQLTIELPVKSLSTGTYIVKLKTDKGETSRKIMIN